VEGRGHLAGEEGVGIGPGFVKVEKGARESLGVLARVLFHGLAVGGRGGRSGGGGRGREARIPEKSAEYSKKNLFVCFF
jgi:hypothetical protein